MRINYFEEFPTTENLKKAVNLTEGSLVFLATENFQKYEKLKTVLLSENTSIKVGYWPIFKSTYWLSGLTWTAEIVQVAKEIENTDDPVLLDLELPFVLGKIKSLTNIFSIGKNKRLIAEVVKNKNVYTYEVVDCWAYSWLLRLLGVKYGNIGYNRRIFGFYDYPGLNFAESILKKLVSSTFNKGVNIGVGTIGKGIIGKEKDISLADLEEKLNFLSARGVNEIFVYRLGGLNKEYQKVLDKFSSAKEKNKV